MTVPITWSSAGNRYEPASVSDLTAYRIVQESLIGGVE
jgi:hypothetical protein